MLSQFRDQKTVSGLEYKLILSHTCTHHPKGGRGCLMSVSCLESQGCHLIPLSYLLSYFFLFFSYFFLLLLTPSSSFCFVICLLMIHSPDSFLRKLKYVSLRVGLFCMALVEQLGDDSW